MAEVVASSSVSASALAFGGSSDLSFLAAGTGHWSANNSLLVYRTAAADYVDGLLPLVARFPSPAAFRSIAWSRPTEAIWCSSALPAGLIAGGLESGVVAVWDPRHSLVDISESDTDRIIEDYFCLNELPQVHGTTPNLAANSATAISDPQSDDIPSQKPEEENERKDGRWFSPFILIDDHFSPTGPPPQPPSPPSVPASMVALLPCHSPSPVLGLSFSPMRPHYLASGAAKGKVLIWDLFNPSAENISHFQCIGGDNVRISDLSWNALTPNTVASASNAGVAIWDISAKSPMIRIFSSNETCSAIEWCPTDNNMMVVAAANCCKVWDLRNVKSPLHHFSGDTKSIRAMSWSPFEEDIVIGCSQEKFLILDVKSGEVVNEKRLTDECLDVCWSQIRANHFALATKGKKPISDKVKEPIIPDEVNMYCYMGK